MQPLISSLLAICLFCGALAGVLVWCGYVIVAGWIRAWRNERTLQNARDNLLIARGFKTAQRLGYLPEDAQ